MLMAYLLDSETKKLVLFNGPRHSGKDTAALRCVTTFGAHHFKFSAPIKAAIKAAFELTDQDVEFLESIKTKPCDLLFGKSYVEVQISFSEDWVKRFWGKYTFGHFAERHLLQVFKKQPRQSLYVCSDSGFKEEVEAIIGLFGRENVLLVHTCRTGKDFTGDSRGYIDLPKVAHVTVSNNLTIDDYNHAIDDVIHSFLYNQQCPV